MPASYTYEELVKAVAENGSQTKAATALGLPKSTLQEALAGRRGTGRCANSADADFARAEEAVSGAPVSPARGGIPLKNRQVLARRPTSLWPARLRALRRGYGYPVPKLAEQWGVSVESVRKKAKDMRCLRYVIDDDGQCLDVVVHPETERGA